MCASIHWIVRIWQPSQQVEAHIIYYRHVWEGRTRLSVECIPPSLVSISFSPSPLPVKLCHVCLHRSVQELEFYSLVECTPPSLVSISSYSSYLSVTHVCTLIRSKARIIHPSHQANAHFLCKRDTLEGRRSLSVECIRPSLVSISSYPSYLSVKLSPMCVHWSVQELEFFCIISRLMHLEGSKSLSVECTPPTLVFISSSPSPLSAKLCPSIRSIVGILQPNQQAEAHIIRNGHICEDRRSL